MQEQRAADEDLMVREDEVKLSLEIVNRTIGGSTAAILSALARAYLAMVAERDEAAKGRDAWLREYKAMQERCYEAEARLHEARAQLTASEAGRVTLLEALAKYGRHSQDCADDQRLGRPCSCGLIRALALAEPAKAGEP